MTKRFGKIEALRRCNLVVPSGSIYGFLGSNGAGKSTCIRLLLGLLEPDSGTIAFDGTRVCRGERPYIGAVSDARGAALYDHLSAADNLAITCCLRYRARREVDGLLELVGLAHARSKRVAEFSTGMRQRLAIARALVGEPSIVILDEPLNGLDPEGIREMRRLIRDLAGSRGMTMIVCSHLLGEVEKVASHVGLLHRGTLVAQGAIGQVIGSHPQVRVAASHRNPHLVEQIVEGFGQIRASDEGLLLDASPACVPDLAQRLVTSGARVERLEPVVPSLEGRYHELVRAA